MALREILRTDRADEDLIEIWSAIARDSPASADRTLDAIELRWRRLARFPFSGRARDEIGPGVRCLVVGQSLTPYMVGEAAITDLRVLHGQRKIERGSVKGFGQLP